ncbi:hypothetical protein CAMGR0001_1201 [Campylobacter gracilis RM3268]|uniref:Uncharacterized protein n=1 Tax=Campylobacter gracilis RM3268 TaxID=553220 RepID=C8PJ02_9BACT|nr:hypothetical protein CAMGR0001_1201 [Campylobacter gracilis RM3268]
MRVGLKILKFNSTCENSSISRLRILIQNFAATLFLGMR